MLPSSSTSYQEHGSTKTKVAKADGAGRNVKGERAMARIRSHRIPIFDGIVPSPQVF